MAQPGIAPQPFGLSRRPETADSFPGLDVLGDRICNATHDMLTRFGCRTASISRAETELVSAHVWHARRAASALCLFSMSPLKGHAMLSIDAEMIARLVDVFYGGSGNVGAFQQQFGSADVRMIARIGDYLIAALPSIWRDSAVVAPELVPDSMAGQAPTGGGGNIIVQSFAVTGLGASPVRLCWAYPVELLRQVPALAGDLAEPVPAFDRVWTERLNRAVMEVSMPVRTIFARPEVPLSRLLVLKPGDIIPVCLPSTVPVTIGGRIFAEGVVGESGGRTAIRIARIAEGLHVDD